MQAGGLPSSAGPHWAAIVEAVSAAVSAVLLAGGAWFAQRYLARGNTSVEATLFEHSDGLGLHVRPSIQSLGLSPLRLRHEDELAPVIEVSEYRGDDGSPLDSEIFLLSLPSTGVIGWRIILAKRDEYVRSVKEPPTRVPSAPPPSPPSEPKKARA
jgi:hypothetical protein